LLDRDATQAGLEAEPFGDGVIEVADDHVRHGDILSEHGDIVN
jgi:hypothetical protein